MHNVQQTLYQWKGRPGPAQSVPMALEHLLAMVVGCISPSALIAAAAGLSAAQTIAMVQAGLLVSGIATLLQVFPLFGKIGAALPLVCGTSYAFVPVLSSVAGTQGMAAMVGAQLVGSIAAIIFGMNMRKLRRFFPAVVTGTVVITVGWSLYSIAISNMAGGEGSADFGSWQNWLLSIVTLVITTYFSFYGKGFLKVAAVLVGIGAGYVIALAMGRVDFTQLSGAQAFEPPALLPFGIRFDLSAIIVVVVMYIVNSVQVVGEISATTQVAIKRYPTCRELRGGVVGNGMAGVIGALLGSVPTSALGRNMGIVGSTKVINRTVFALTAAFMLLAAFMPGFGALLTTIPRSVMGGATLAMFGAITMMGVKLVLSGGNTWRAATISGLSIALCAGILAVPQSIGQFPEWFKATLGTSPVAISALSAVILNIVLPKNIKHPNDLAQDMKNSAGKL